MPNKDRTGPNGEGAGTGRGLGMCGGFNRGCGRRFGRGFLRNSGRQVEFSSEDEKKILEAELVELDKEKSDIQKRLKDLK